MWRSFSCTLGSQQHLIWGQRELFLLAVICSQSQDLVKLVFTQEPQFPGTYKQTFPAVFNAGLKMSTCLVEYQLISRTLHSTAMRNRCTQSFNFIFLWLETHLVTCMHFKTVTVSQTAPSKQTSTEDLKFLFKKQQ